MLLVFFVLMNCFMQICICQKDTIYYMLDAAEDPEDVISPQREFKVYWNVPTTQCRSKKVPFDNLHQFGIIQNENDNFRQGDKMSILYDPGFFPAMFNSGPGIYRYRNGGVPQQGNIQKHLDAFKISVDEMIPNKNYNGIAVIDFESWKPIFQQNDGILKPYVDVSFDIERKEHWWWPQSWIKNTAQERYERAAKNFLESTLRLAKKMRPKATWGYYGYPYCHNRGSDDACFNRTIKGFEGLDWLWNESTGIFPAVYTSIKLTPKELQKTARRAVEEAARVSRSGVVLPYISYVYRDQRSSYYKESDLEVLLDTIYNSKAGGVVVWGASSDVNTKKQCIQLLKYITYSFGPLIEKFTKGDRRRATEITSNASIAENATKTIDILITTEDTTLANEPTTEMQAFSEPSHRSNLTQLVKNGSKFKETKKLKQDTLSGEIILNSIIQFFDMADSTKSIIETSEQSEFTQNPDDTPGFTQNEIEIIPETNSQHTDYTEYSVPIKIKSSFFPTSLPVISLPISAAERKPPAKSANHPGLGQPVSIHLPLPFTSYSASLRKLNTSTSVADSTTTILFDSYTEESEPEFYTSSSMVATGISMHHEIETDVTTIPQESISDKFIFMPDNESDNNEILESLANITGNLDEHNTSESPSTNKTMNVDEDLVNANKILQDITDDGNLFNDQIKTIVDNNQPNDVNHFYDFATVEDTLDSLQDSKSSGKNGQDDFEDDMILEAVAEILNSTDRTQSC